MPSTLTKAVELLLRGNYCLWAGAGITTQLASASAGPNLGWDSLLTAMEAEAGVSSPPSSTSYPKRLDVCFRHLSEVRFQQVVRKTIYGALVDRIIQAARNTCKLSVPVPNQVTQIAQLGMLANPIVNFNIETLTSEILAGPHYQRCFLSPTINLPVRIEKRRASSMFTDGPQFLRIVYHPHGSIDVTGKCVLTSSDYRNLRGTLAYQLAAHQAFDSDLVIVGMSLEDHYLRRQLGAFRNQVRDIRWFTDIDLDAHKPLRRWVKHYGITVIPVIWPDFWKEVSRILPSPKPDELAFRWMSLVMCAATEKTGTASKMNRAFVSSGMDPVHIEKHKQAAELRGELLIDASVDDLSIVNELFSEVLPLLTRYKLRLTGKGLPSAIPVP